MKKGCLIFVTIILIVFLTGCFESSTEVEEDDNNIQFESDVVDLIYTKLNFVKDNNIIIRTEIEFLLKNIAGRVLNLRIIGEFYDKDNNLLYSDNTHTMDYMPVDYEETELLAANIISYSGEDASLVDHVKLTVIER